MEIDDRTEYDILKQKTKVLASKYPIGNQFINYIDECDFLTNSKINRNNKYPTAICPFGYPQHELHKPVLPPCGHRYRTYLLYNEPSLRPFMIATPKAAH